MNFRKESVIRVYEFSRAAATKYHKRLKTTEVYSCTVLEGTSQQLRGQQGHAPSDALGRILPWLAAGSLQSLPLWSLGHLLPVSFSVHMVFVCVYVCLSVCLLFI